jgi:hypothetical protein
LVYDDRATLRGVFPPYAAHASFRSALVALAVGTTL